jgi:photosystem II stability/assembly factor-like uncharacterized protein
VSSVYRSLDAGRTWTTVLSSAGGQITSLAVAPTDSSVAIVGLYAGSSGVLVSHDGGGTWSPAISNAIVEAVAIDPITSSTIYAAGDTIFKSVDGGRTWSRSGSGFPLGDIATAIAIAPTSGSTLYATTGSHGVYASFDGGASWTPANAGIDQVGMVAVATSPSSPQAAFAGSSYQAGSAVYKTTSAGR